MAASEPVASGPVFPPILDNRHADAPAARDLLSCIHCGLCLNACPTYRELGVEMDSPRGRIYQMVQVATGQMAISPSYLEHLDLCLACRGCETACPSGVPYGRLIEAARTEIEAHIAPKRSLPATGSAQLHLRRLLLSRGWLKLAGACSTSIRPRVCRPWRAAREFSSSPASWDGSSTWRPRPRCRSSSTRSGRRSRPRRAKYRVALLAGCIANVSCARLNEATVRVLQKNGCEVVIPEAQTCCGALHVHAGLKDDARALARQNIDAFLPLAESEP